ncbi:MAG: DUF2252 domain-containing protein [Atopobiaceae bacterium]|nr:DUF2252 domain-containing protein [Atopobiaceae bacterium]
MVYDPLEQHKRLSHIVHEALEVQDIRTYEEHAAHGEGLRNKVPFEEQGTWEAPKDRPDPLVLLAKQERTRVPSLVPLRHERMALSPFAFFRGAALIMASDLARTPTTDIEVQICGDAHIANFGLFKSPERRMIFDINDFDETARGPWEWDLKRLVTSIEICGRDREFSVEDREKAVLICSEAYRSSMADFAKSGHLEVWYDHVDIEELFDLVSDDLPKEELESVRAAVKKMRRRDSTKAVAKLTEVIDGHQRFISNPPLIIPLRDAALKESFAGIVGSIGMEKLIKLALSEYCRTLPPETRHLIKQYRGVDAAHKVVGVGSVGLRSLIVVLEGVDRSDSIVLQIKEAQESVIEQYYGKGGYSQHGQRVVRGQRALQSFSDILLGWCRLPNEDGSSSDYYVRQLWNGKGSIDLTTISPEMFQFLCAVCGWTLAHGHARTGNRFHIAGYLGNTDDFDHHMVRFAKAYAEQNEADYNRFKQAFPNSAPESD